MKKEIKDSYSDIKLSETSKRALYEKILTEGEKRKQEKSKKGCAHIVPRIAIAAMIAVICASSLAIGNVALAQNGLLEEIQNLFSGFFQSDNEIIDYGNEDLTDFVSENVYMADDGHVRFEVLEKITDSVQTYMTIRYKAIDTWGMEWLNKNTENGRIKKALYANLVFPDNNTKRYGVNYGCYIEDLEEYNTEREKYFVLFLAALSGDYQSNKITLQYKMPDGTETAELDVGDGLQFVKYKLSGDNNEYFSTDYLYVSGLSFVVYGQLKDGVSLTDITSMEWGGDESVTFYYQEDGTEKYVCSDPQEMIHYWGRPKKSEYNQYSNLVIASGNVLLDQEENLGYDSARRQIPKVAAFDPESITKFVIKDKTGEYTYQVERIE